MTQLVDLVGNGYNIAVDVPHFGLEVELEGVESMPSLRGTGWTNTHDGSLRGSGVEFLSHSPRPMADVTEDVRFLYRAINERAYTRGVRTSTHVHVNVLGHEPLEVAAACVAYILVEPLLYRYCGPTREENIYCVPWYRAPDEIDLVEDLTRRARFGALHEACKYSGLHLEPLLRFGTLEFRQAPVFETDEELLAWIRMCEAVAYCGFSTPAEVMDAWNELSVDEFVEGLFGPHLTDLLREACERDFEDLLDHYDVETLAERASASTYQPRGWFIPTFSVEGTGHIGYHTIPNRGRHMMYEPSWYDEGDDLLDEDYDPEEDY